MKKLTLLNCMLLALTSLKTLGQTGDPANLPVKTGNEWQMPKDVLQRAKSFSAGLQKTLNLSDAVTQKVFNAYLGNTKSVDEIRVGQGSEKEKKAALAANQEAFDQGLKGILSPTQFETYMRQKKSNPSLRP